MGSESKVDANMIAQNFMLNWFPNWHCVLKEKKNGVVFLWVFLSGGKRIPKTTKERFDEDRISKIIRALSKRGVGVAGNCDQQAVSQALFLDWLD